MYPIFRSHIEFTNQNIEYFADLLDKNVKQIMERL